MKIDRRKNYYIVLDTETCPLDNTIDIVSPQNMFTYDLGFAVIDKKGNVYESKSLVITEIFDNEKDLMNSSYYANKLPKYYEALANGERERMTFYNARKVLCELMEKYNTHIVIAHNARFDYGTLQNTYRWLTKSKYRYFFPYGTEIWDTMKMANDTLCKEWGYKEFCKSNGYLTKNGQVRKTAEILYRYISGDNEFVEEHQGLDDVLIEKEIFVACMRKHKPFRKSAWA